MNEITLTYHNGIPLADSRTIAEHCKVQHETTMRLIREHLEVIEGNFGRVRFEIGAFETNGGRQNIRYALLTEDQSTFLITLTRNTAPVIAFKAALVRAFREARDRLAEPEVEEIEHPANEYLALLDGLMARGIRSDKAIYSLGNLFMSSVAHAISSGRRMTPLRIPDQPEKPATRKALQSADRAPSQRYEIRYTIDHIADVLGDKGQGYVWKVAELQEHCRQKTGMSKATFYRLWPKVVDSGKVTLPD